MGKLKKLLLGMVFGLFFISSVNADTLNNLSVSVEHESGFENSYMDLYLKITADEFSNNTYKSLITKNTDDVSETIADSSTLISMTSSISQPTFFKVAPVDYINYASKYGDLYLTLYEYDGEKYNKVSDPLLVKRPTLLNYGSRIDASFYDDKSISLNFNEIYNEESSIKIKIGSVDSFKGNSYDELVNFAKNDSGIFNKTIALNSYNDNYDTWGKYQNVYDNTNIVNGNYYYVYFEIDADGGKYYPLNDVGVYKAKNGSLSAEEISRIVRNETPKESVPVATTTNKDDKKTSETTTNPKTGVYGGSILLVACAIVGYIVIKRKNKFKNI